MSSRKPIYFTNKSFQRGSEDSDDDDKHCSSDEDDAINSEDRYNNVDVNYKYNSENDDEGRDEFEIFQSRNRPKSKHQRQRRGENRSKSGDVFDESIISLSGGLSCDSDEIVLELETYDSAFPGKYSHNAGSMSSGRRSGERQTPGNGRQAPETEKRERSHHRSQANAADRPRKKRSSGAGVKSNDDISTAVKTTAPEQTEQRNGSGQAGGVNVRGSEAGGTRLSSPPRSTLRSAVYYQNRFIVLETPESHGGSDGYAANPAHNSKRSRSRDQVSNSSHRVDGTDLNKETSFNSGAGKHGRKMSSDIQRKTGNRRNMEMDASSVTMDARGIEIILTDPENSSRPIASESKNKNTIWKKINRFLQDNRMKGNPDSDRILNSNHPEDYRILKKVLNILFLTIGVVLFLAVIVVVIYAFAVGDPPLIDDFSTTTTLTTASVTTMSV